MCLPVSPALQFVTGFVDVQRSRRSGLRVVVRRPDPDERAIEDVMKGGIAREFPQHVVGVERPYGDAPTPEHGRVEAP